MQADVQPSTYRLVRHHGAQIEGKIAVVPPRSEDFAQWGGVLREVQSVAPGHTWVNGFYDLEIPNKFWLVNASGVPSHYLEAFTPAQVAKGDGNCPKCGVPGQFFRMALVCNEHGAYAGL